MQDKGYSYNVNSINILFESINFFAFDVQGSDNSWDVIIFF